MSEMLHFVHQVQDKLKSEKTQLLNSLKTAPESTQQLCIANLFDESSGALEAIIDQVAQVSYVDAGTLDLWHELSVALNSEQYGYAALFIRLIAQQESVVVR